jgi:hypothetical protein
MTYDEFWKLYATSLKAAIENRPGPYMLALNETPQEYSDKVAERARETYERCGLGAISVPNSAGWRGAAKAVGLKCTYRALVPYMLALPGNPKQGRES